MTDTKYPGKIVSITNPMQFSESGIPLPATADDDAVLWLITSSDTDSGERFIAQIPHDKKKEFIAYRPARGKSGKLLQSLFFFMLSGAPIPAADSPIIMPVSLFKAAAKQKNSLPRNPAALLIEASRGAFPIHSIQTSSENQSDAIQLPAKYAIRALARALLPWPYKRLNPQRQNRLSFLRELLHPVRLIRRLMHENASPAGLAAAAAAGMFLGTLPLIATHNLAILYVCFRWRLNKVMAIAISHLCMPPLLPFACIELGYFMRHGNWLKEASMQTIIAELHLRLLDWLLGAIILAPLNAIVFASIVYFIAEHIAKKTHSEKENC